MVENIKLRLMFHDVRIIWNLHLSVDTVMLIHLYISYGCLCVTRAQLSSLYERLYSHHVQFTTNCNDAVGSWQHFKMYIIIHCHIYLLFIVSAYSLYKNEESIFWAIGWISQRCSHPNFWNLSLPLYGKGDFVDEIKLRILRGRDHPGLSGCVQCEHRQEIWKVGEDDMTEAEIEVMHAPN